ncbi:MAG: hypothetical protein K2X87_30070 [Gemmataceae bacterium]|nr:hypothetical protein [Gemmataceae bacterium]
MPLLEATCVRCHGGKMRRADLDLRTASGVPKGGESGPVVLAGQAREEPAVRDGSPR